MKPFTFHNPGRIVFGEDKSLKVAEEFPGLGVKSPILVTDETMAGSDPVEAVRAVLGDALVAQFTEVVPDTGIDIIDQAAEVAREAGADSVISMGGGSTIDTAKAIAAMLGTGVKSVREILGFFKLDKKPVPHIVIPTTAGTGSESTSMAVIKDRDENKKVLLLDQKLIPDLGILDPKVTITMPRGITAATGMDAMTHAAEAVMSRKSTPFADGLALHAITMVKDYLPVAVENGNDLDARGMMLAASNMAGQAFQNSLVGVVHAMAHALGGIVGLPHGLANGVLLWVGMEYNAETVPEKVATIGRAMGVESVGDAKKDAAAAVEAVREFSILVGIPGRLKHAGVDPSCLAEVAELALADPALLTNPRKPKDAGEIEALLHKCI